jgi:raffinose/stachyose/melibiose transport system permease protein
MLSAKRPSGNFLRKQRWIVYASLIPIFLYHFILIVAPTVRTVFLSFTNWNGLATKDFIGIGNYIELFGDPNFIDALLDNLKWTILFLTIPIIAGIVIGYILSSVPKGRLFFRAAYFLPYVVAAAIAGKIFASFFNPYFGINVVLEHIGLKALAQDWLSPGLALTSVAFVDMWHWWGFLLVIFLSGLQQIDPMLYESATVDGANEVQKFLNITLPCIKSTMIFIILITMVWSVSTFDYVWVMTRGGPGTELLSTLLYKNAYMKYRAGYAASIAVVQMFISFVIFAVFGIIRKKAEED